MKCTHCSGQTEHISHGALSKAFASDQVETNRRTAPHFETKENKIPYRDSASKMWYPGGIQIKNDENARISNSLPYCFLVEKWRTRQDSNL